MGSLADLLATGLHVRPDCAAIEAHAGAITFRELDRSASTLARELLNKYRVLPGDRVIVLAEKAIEIVIAAHAIWKAGAIYVPIDVRSPMQRTTHILSSINPVLVISSQRMLIEMRDALGCTRCISYEEIRVLPKVRRAPILPAIDGSQPALIIYTSGSTGFPKGVILSHASVLTYFHNHNDFLRFNPEARGMNNGPFHFDVSIQDTFLPLYFGATVIFHQDIFLSSYMINLVKRQEVTHLIAVSSVLDLISRDGEKMAELQGSALKVVVTGGEICDPKLIARWFAAKDGVRVLYGYGPTECNSLCITHEILAPEPDRIAPYPIGKPFRGMKAVLIDSRGAVVRGSGQRGVLAIAGPQLMTGYWRNADETELAFVNVDNEIFYVTGDHCYRDASDNYHFVGRTDSEVKIRGRRINLNEIRNALMSKSQVQYAAVGTIEIGGETRIFAFVQVDDAAAIQYEELEKIVAKRVPNYMVPTHLCVSSEVVRTSTTKIDERQIVERVRSLLLRDPSKRFVQLT